jgi:hypothetical protein
LLHRGRGGRLQRSHRHRGGARRQLARHTHAHAFAVDLDLGQACLREELGELTYQLLIDALIRIRLGLDVLPHGLVQSLLKSLAQRPDACAETVHP